MKMDQSNNGTHVNNSSWHRSKTVLAFANKILIFFTIEFAFKHKKRVHIEETLRMNTIFISIKSKAELLW